ncbi:MAG: DUF1523 family protein [Moraxellaceae bacterium]
MEKVRTVVWTLIGIVVVILALVLAYSLPQHRVVHVSGHEVKRLDMNGNVVDPTKAVAATRDVYFINVADPRTGEVHVYRNEDTRFGFPFYMKFDSPEVLGQAQMLEKNPDQLALVTYYGWRIKLLDEFPNAVNVEPWNSPEEPFPIFNTVFLVVLGLILLLLWWKWRQFRQRRAAKP